jgi:hypothetical protein
MGGGELREAAERYRKLAAECGASELRALLLACAQGYDEEAADADAFLAIPPLPPALLGAARA